MPRLRQVARSDTDDPTVIGMYDYLFGDRDPVAEPGTAVGTPGDWWTVFALVPPVLKHCVQGFALYQSPDRLLDPRLRELGQLRVGWARASRFVYSQHCKSARAAGVPEAQVQAVAHWAVAECFSPVERAVLAYTDALVLDGGRVADGVFDMLREHLTDEQILELTYITSLYDMHAVMSRALRTEFDDVPEAMTEVPAPDEPPPGVSVGPNAPT
jgi:alkylhydroperoxidase family enzyme